MRTTEDMLGLVPNTLREAASALGMPRSLVIRNVAYRAVMSGLVTGILLAVARMTGETAPLIFTALGNSLFSVDVTQPMSSLPLIIYEFARSPYPEQQKLAWTGALIVTAAVLSLSIVARVLAAPKRERQLTSRIRPVERAAIMACQIRKPKPNAPGAERRQRQDRGAQTSISTTAPRRR